MEAFRAAIALDSTYAGAYAGLALTCCAQAGLRARPHLGAYAEAKTAALRALAMDDQCADAQVALGTVLFLSEWDWAGAERSFEHALELNPNHTEAYLHYGSLMDATGRLDRGLALKQQALERDPFSAMVQIQIATSYLHQRRYDDVIVWANKALELDPKHLLAREFLAGAYWMQGDVDRFLAANVAQAHSFGATEAALADVRRSCSEMRTAYAADGRPGLARYMLALYAAASRQPGDPACGPARRTWRARLRVCVFESRPRDARPMPGASCGVAAVGPPPGRPSIRLLPRADGSHDLRVVESADTRASNLDVSS